MSFDEKKMTGASSDDQGSGINHWLCLSDEMALYILRYIPQKSLKTVSLVNKKFRDLSRDGSLWTELTLDLADIEHNAESCRKLVERCNQLATLKISNKLGRGKKLDIMSVVIRAKESLRSLEVDTQMVDILTTAANTKLGCLTNLTSLEINSRPKKENSYVGAKIMEELANLQKLEVLNLLIAGHRESLSVMKTVFGKLKKLKEVKIWLFGLGCLDDHHLEDGVVDERCFVGALATNNPDLRALNLLNTPPLSDETLVLLANSCLGLEEFSYSTSSGYLGFNIAITDSGIERMVGAAKNMKHLHLNLGRLPRVTEELVKRLGEEYPYLLSLLSNW